MDGRSGACDLTRWGIVPCSPTSSPHRETLGAHRSGGDLCARSSWRLGYDAVGLGVAPHRVTSNFRPFCHAFEWVVHTTSLGVSAAVRRCVFHMYA